VRSGDQTPGDLPVLSVLGELVIDLLPVPDADAGPEGTAPHFVARPGGNALNVAVAAARLGTPVHLLARLGTGPLGANLRRHAEASGVDVSGFVAAEEPVSLAVVGLGPDGSADYGFHVDGAADWQWTDHELSRVVPDRTAILHVGSISSWTAPGSDAIARLVERLHGTALISVDPNIRPMLAEGPVGTALGNTRTVVGSRLDRLITQADVVKVSAEDLDWLGNSDDLDAAAREWATLGPAVVLVVDTVGAGDSLAAGFLSGLVTAGVTTRAALESLPDEQLAGLVDDAALIAALNCTRVGADPPTRAELDAAHASR
jgi:fructokinase